MSVLFTETDSKTKQCALTRQQFAAAVQVSTALVDKWIRFRKLQVVKLGRCVRIPVDELRRVLKEGIRCERQIITTSGNPDIVLSETLGARIDLTRRAL